MKSKYKYVCLDCRLAPQVSIEGRVSLPVVATRDILAKRHAKNYNHRVAVVNARRKIVKVYYLDFDNKFMASPWKGAPKVLRGGA